MKKLKQSGNDLEIIYSSLTTTFTSSDEGIPCVNVIEENFKSAQFVYFVYILDVRIFQINKRGFTSLYLESYSFLQ